MKSHTSIHWSRWKKHRFLTSDTEKLKDFRNNNLSIGLDDFIDLDYGELLFKKLLNDLREEEVLNFFNDKNIGNSKSIKKYNKKIIHYSHLFFIKWISILKNHIDFGKEIKIICEIGGGYGALTEKLLMFHSCKVIMIDLELTNQLSYYYLKQNFPSLKIQTFNSENLKKLDYNLFNSVDVIILTPDILIDEKIKIDLFVNSRSFAEMEYKSIQDYFKLIQNNLRDNGFFLNINRYIKRSVGYNIFFHRYPYNLYWKEIFSEKAWEQDKIHFLLTQKINYKNINFLSTIKKIKEITKIQKKKDFIEIKKNMPKNIFYKSILLTIEIILNFLEVMLPYKLYIFLSRFRYTVMAKNK